MSLYIRMMLYPLFGALATMGYLTFDPATGLISTNANNVALMLTSGVSYVLTFAWSRYDKLTGGPT